MGNGIHSSLIAAGIKNVHENDIYALVVKWVSNSFTVKPLRAVQLRGVAKWLLDAKTTFLHCP